ncbi:hypothetical protein GOV10_05765, partial [Candidatus Woesearchaeota archaeon]|nr:hypothetical protein [Candidatus Woesearchaeota archaeon]
LMSLAKRSGGTVKVLYMCVGSCRQVVTGKTEENVRLEETKNAGKFGDFEYEIAYVGKEFLRLDTVPQRELVDKIEDMYVEFKPDVVVLPSHNSYNQDHRATFTAGITALRPLPKKYRHSAQLVLECEEPYTWTTDDDSFKPNFYIPLTKKDLEAKKKLLACHETQVRDDPFPRSFDNLERIARMRGIEVGEEFAEAYKLLRGFISD